MLKIHDKEKILNAARKKRHYIREMKIRIMEKPLVRSKASEGVVESILKILKAKIHTTCRISHPANTSFKHKGDIKTFSNIIKLKTFITS